MVERGEAWMAVVIYKLFTFEQLVKICSIVPEKCKAMGFQPPPPNEDTVNQSTIHIKADITSMITIPTQ